MVAGRSLLLGACACLLRVQQVVAHEHNDTPGQPGEPLNLEPIDAILWAHILVQLVAWGLLFPTGMVLGLAKNRWHVPVQASGALLAVAGYFLGHAHKGRQYGHSAHASFAPWLHSVLAAQVIVGIYLKMHWTKGIHSRIRRVFTLGHRIIGPSLPVLAWIQILFGAIVLLGFCKGDHLGQCAAHFIMGSAFIAYGIILLILLLLGQAWLQRTGRSQEFFDSALIAVWGCINTFTEHRWGNAWVHNDVQHTSMGVVWWCAGLAGMWLSSGTDGRPRRNLIPAIVIFLTGFAMSAHPQALMVSAKSHSIFGYTLMGAGISRIIEISYILLDKPTLSIDGTRPNSFQYMTPLLLFAGGFLFMGITEEQMAILNKAKIDHVSYVLLIWSATFLFFLYVNVLINAYTMFSKKPALYLDLEEARNLSSPAAPHEEEGTLRAVEEFELGPVSDDEGDDENEILIKASGNGRETRRVGGPVGLGL